MAGIASYMRTTAATQHRSMAVNNRHNIRDAFAGSPYLNSVTMPLAYRSRGARTAPTLYGTPTKKQATTTTPHSRPAPRLLDLAQSPAGQQMIWTRPKSAASEKAAERRRIAEEIQARRLATERSIDHMTNAERRLDDDEDDNESAAAAVAALQAQRTRITRPSSAGAALMRRPSVDAREAAAAAFAAQAPSTAAAAQLQTQPNGPNNYGLHRKSDKEAPTAESMTEAPQPHELPELNGDDEDEQPVAATTVLTPQRQPPQRQPPPPPSHATGSGASAITLLGHARRAAWDANGPSRISIERPVSASAARRREAAAAAALQRAQQQQQEEEEEELYLQAQMNSYPAPIEHQPEEQLSTDLAAASAAITAAATSAANALNAAAAAASAVAAAQQQAQRLAPPPPPMPPPPPATTTPPPPPAAHQAPAPAYAASHTFARTPPTYQQHTFSSGTDARALPQRPASANLRARADAAAAAARAAEEEARAAYAATASQRPANLDRPPVPRQRPQSAGNARRTPASTSSSAAQLNARANSLLSGGAPSPAEEWLEQHQQQSQQRAEIDALRRRTLALQNGTTMAHRSAAGPNSLSRPSSAGLSRPGSASRNGRFSAVTAAANAAAARAPAAAMAPSALTPAPQAHRAAPTRPSSAGRTRPPPRPAPASPDSDDDTPDEAPLNVGQYRRQAQRTLMLSHLRESSAHFPGLANLDWAHLDNQGLHAAVSAIVRVSTALQASGVNNSAEAVAMQQQLAALYAAAGKQGAAGLSEEQLDRLECVPCDKPRLQKLIDAERPTCAICHEDFAVGDSLRCLPACDHTYHANCIGHWLRIKAACPLCQQKVKVP